MDKLSTFFNYDTNDSNNVMRHNNKTIWFREDGIWYKICNRCKTKKSDVEYYFKRDCYNQRRGTCISCCKDDNKKSYNKIRNNPILHEKHLNNQYEWIRKKLESNPQLRMQESVRCSIVGYIKKSKHKKAGGVKKESKTADIIGCDKDQFIEWMESHLEDWMNWDNYGTEWIVGHVVPASWGNSDWNKIKRLYHYKNLYTQCAIENGKLGARIWENKYGDWHIENLKDIVDEYNQNQIHKSSDTLDK